MDNSLLAAAAEAMEVPAAMVERSAQARADADGLAIDEVLAAWSGGGTVSPTPVQPAPTPEPEPAPQPVVAAVAEPTKPAPRQSHPEPVAPPMIETPAPEGSPVLEGRAESLVTLLAGAVGMFLIAALFAFVLPALDASSETPPPSGLSELGRQGREVYVAEGCWYCHTQQVRPIVTDANLGPVTQAGTLAAIAPDTLGVQRIGPDLAHVGSRAPTDDTEWLTEFLTAPNLFRERNLQPDYGHLPDADIAALVRYLLESR